MNMRNKFFSSLRSCKS